MKMKKIAMAGLATAALVFAPSAAADVPGLAPFVGSSAASWNRLASVTSLPLNTLLVDKFFIRPT
jgi:hypothetical protein